jgi:hypothetical protein
VSTLIKWNGIFHFQVFFFETESHYEPQTCLWTHNPKCWDYRQALLHLALIFKS